MIVKAIDCTECCVADDAEAVLCRLSVLCQPALFSERSRALWTLVAVDDINVRFDALERREGLVAVQADAVPRALFVLRCGLLRGKGRVADVAGMHVAEGQSFL